MSVYMHNVNIKMIIVHDAHRQVESKAIRVKITYYSPWTRHIFYLIKHQPGIYKIYRKCMPIIYRSNRDLVFHDSSTTCTSIVSEAIAPLMKFDAAVRTRGLPMNGCFKS